MLLIALFAGAALISGFTILQGIDPFDEGLMLQAASRIARGQVPYRDFLWSYGPAQPYLLAGLAKLFGPSLVHWRIIRVLADAAVTLIAYLLTRRRAGVGLSLVVWLAVAAEMAEPRSANPIALALLFALFALLCATAGHGGKRPAILWPSVLTALAAAFRLDFGLYALAGIAVALVAGGTWRAALRFAGVSVALIALIYLPFAILDGPGSLYTALIGTSLRTGAYWSLPFPLEFHARSGGGLAGNVKHAVDFYVPLLLLLGFAAAVVGVLAMLRSQRRLAPLETGLLVFGSGALSYLLSRTDEFHAQPLFAAVTILLGLLLAPARAMAVAGRRTAAVAGLVPLSLVLALLCFHGFANRISALTRPPVLSTIRVPVADGVEAPPAEARAIERMVALVQAHDPPRQPIFAATRRSDLIRINAPLIYVLTQRPNPYREDFGLATGAAAQRRIVATLTAAQPRVIVRWTDPTSSASEPNLRGRSSGVHTLDRWIAEHYALLARLYHYDVLIIRRRHQRRG